jgi:pre-rRNA-processing protein TSR3
LDFRLYSLRQRPDLSHHLLLAPEAPPLTLADAGRTLVLLDANWREAAKMRKAVEPVDVRSIPPGWRTAYPRRSKIHADPVTGLATVEALFAAHCVLGRRDDSLLRFYPWRNVFLAINRDLVPEGSSA